MDIKEWVLDRIEQSFTFFMQNIKIFLPPQIIVIVWVMLIDSIFSPLVLKYLTYDFDNLSVFLSINNFNILLYYIVLALLQIILTISVFLWSIRMVELLKNGEQKTYKDIFSYGWHHILDSFYTYYYVFLFVYAIPCSFIIVWGLMLNFYYLAHSVEIIKDIWTYLLIFWFIIWIVLGIFRWLRCMFSVTQAVCDDDYSKDNFRTSIEVTKNQLWRIIGNFFVVWLVVSLLGWLVSSPITLFSTHSKITEGIQSQMKMLQMQESRYDNMANNMKGGMSGDMQSGWMSYTDLISDENMEKMMLKQLVPDNLIVSILQWIIEAFKGVFMLIFSVFLFYRLRQEKASQNNLEQQIASQ